MSKISEQEQRPSTRRDKPAWLSFEYWLGQMLVIAATIIGVYLAAVVGFQQAVDFEVFNEYMEEYDVATSLYAEASANADYIEAQANKRLAEPKSARLGIAPIALNQFVWNTMQYNPQTFELSANTIHLTQQYYKQAAKAYKQLNALYDDETVAAANKLLAQTTQFRTAMLEPLAERIAFLEGKLVEYDDDIVN